jgi:hypothetical protein
MEHDETKSSPTSSENTVLSSCEHEASSAPLLADEVGLRDEEVSGSAEEEAVLTVEALEEFFLGPDDEGSMQTKYGGPAMMHPGGDLTVRVAQECHLLVAFDGTKHEVFSPGDILPTDLWNLKSGSVVAEIPMTLHMFDGGVMVVHEGSQLPKTCLLVEKGKFYRP